MRRHWMTAVVVLATLYPAPAAASDKQDFITCDGRIHPGKQDDGMRSAASLTGYGGIATFRGGAVDACTRALASDRLLPNQTLRRAHLLRARSAEYLAIGDNARALSDLELATATVGGLAENPFYIRSMGVSLSLLRALALAQSGNTTAATALAQSAMAGRPYSIEVQQAGADILHYARPVGVSSVSPWSAVVRLNPGATASILVNEAEIGNFAGVIAMRPAVNLNWPSASIAPYALAGRSEAGVQLLSAVIVTLATSYARASAGDTSGAQRDLSELTTRIATARPTTSDASNGFGNSISFEAIDTYIKVRARQINARIAVTEGRTTDAIAALVGLPLPGDAATIELLTAMKAKFPAVNAGLVPDTVRFAEELQIRRKEQLSRLAQAALLMPETPRTVIDYARARPNILGALIGGALSMGTSLLGGVSRTDGFRSTPNPDGSIKIEFIGNTPSAALVQEMTLLRAAELTRESGNSAFVIIARRDFARTMRTTQNGMEISRAAAGFKTELDVRFVKASDQTDRALDASSIIDSLGPFYYEEKPSPK